jgi:Replication initiation factor
MSDQPPSSNTGVPTPTYTVSLDWFAAHIEREITLLVPELAAELGCQYRLGRPINGYSHAADLVSGDDLWCKVCYSPDGTPWLQATGSNSQPVENAIKRRRWTYRVTRKDAALDLFDAEWFPIIVAALKSHAHDAPRPLKVEYAGDWEYGVKGRTLYVGSRQSRALIRCYEKGRKERADPNWIRVEVQYNPQSESESRSAAEMTAAQIWTMRCFPACGKVIGIEPAELFEYPTDQALARPKRSQDRARRALCDQYGKTLLQWVRDHHGDAQSFVADLLQGVEHQQRVRMQSRAPLAPVEQLECPG